MHGNNDISLYIARNFFDDFLYHLHIQYYIYLKRKSHHLSFLSVRRCGRKSNDPQQCVLYADDPDIPEGVSW